MAFRWMLLPLMVLLLLGGVMPVLAQGGDLTYGDEVEGEITSLEQADLWKFEGAAGDVLIVLLTRDAVDSSLNPLVDILAEGEEVLATDDGVLSVEVGVVLPTDGTYTIRVRPRPNSTEVGTYTLRLIQPPTVVLGEPVEGLVTTDIPTYYLLTGQEAVEITYTLGDDDFAPEVALTEIATDSNVEIVGLGFLRALAVISGGSLRYGTLGLADLDPDANYILTVRRSLGTFIFGGPVEVDYSLTVSEFVPK
ncbi:MAG: hypothetical protein ACOCXZ_01750 [Chloroflexota bacterium]